jgi:multidrug resistance efflux pump
MVVEQNQNNTAKDAEKTPGKSRPPADPVRRWTKIVIIICILLLAWYLRADRVTPFTSQARVHAGVVPVASQVSGKVTRVSVSNNQPVKAGQELFQIDQDSYLLAVQTAEASLKAAREAVGAAKATVDAADASVSAARAGVVRTEKDAVRMRNIRQEDPGAISQRRLESAEASYSAALATLAANEANREKAIQSLGDEGERNSKILQAQSALDQARLNLEHTTVIAPGDGVVTGVRLDIGNFASAGAPQMTFVASRDVWLQAEFTENNLGHIDPGDRVDIVFDMLPGQVIHGKVREVGFGVAVDTAPLGSLPTIQNDPNWLRDAQRYPVLIDFDLTHHQQARLLKVGSQASVVVYTGDNAVSGFLADILIRLRSILTYAY